MDEGSAEEGLRAIEIEYEGLPAVVTIKEAMLDGAPEVHAAAPGNICFSDKLEKGDVEVGFAEADTIVEDTFTFPMVYHYAMEPHVAIAEVDAEGITVWTSTAHPFGVQLELVHIFDYPLSSVRVMVPYVGGAYGSKSGAKIEPLVVALAGKCQRPVRLAQNVAEAMMTVRRHSALCKVKTGAKKDGTLVAKQAEIFLNTGCLRRAWAYRDEPYAHPHPWPLSNPPYSGGVLRRSSLRSARPVTHLAVSLRKPMNSRLNIATGALALIGTVGG
ncbi:MAG: molybdopterin-dependent oxidoreductase [Deltaproteobacteria bacterium]|nr:molybdopterin-dependent oxidoreductase [Deltaproteobacteria bacterium]